MSVTPESKDRWRSAVVVWACGMGFAVGLARVSAAAADEPAPASTQVPDVAETRPESTIPPGREGAWLAQKRYRMGKYKEAAEIYLKAVEGASSQSQLDFRYNAAAALYRAEQYQEAADLLNELVGLQASPEGRTAAALGASLYRASEARDTTTVTNLAEKALLLRASGEAFKSAARTGHDADVALRNLAVVLRTLPDVEEQAKIAALVERYKDAQPFGIADEMLTAQREIDGRIPPALTNDSPAQVAQMEDIAQAQNANADLWIPLKSKLLQAASQQGQSADPQQVAAMESLIETTRDHMRDAAASLRDLDGRALDSSRVAADAVYAFWKGLAPYAPLLTEDLRRQTNAIDATALELASPSANTDPISREQNEAAGLTQLFVQRFTEAFPEESAAPEPAAQETPGPTDPSASPSGQPELSAEDRTNILALAASALEAQHQAGSSITTGALDAALRLEQEAYQYLKDIEKLLPRNPDNQQQDQQQQDQQQQDQQPSQEPQDSEQQQQPPPEPQAGQDQQQPEQPQAEPQPAEQDEQRKMTPEDVQRLMEKALQREQEHDAEKRERQRFVPLAPHERDW